MTKYIVYAFLTNVSDLFYCYYYSIQHHRFHFAWHSQFHYPDKAVTQSQWKHLGLEVLRNLLGFDLTLSTWLSQGVWLD